MDCQEHLSHEVLFASIAVFKDSSGFCIIWLGSRPKRHGQRSLCKGQRSDPVLQHAIDRVDAGGRVW